MVRTRNAPSTGVAAQRGRWFEPAMPNAVLAPRIGAWAVTFPGRLGHQAFECLVMAVRDEITGAFPALHVIGGVSPGCAREIPGLRPYRRKVRREADAALPRVPQGR